MKQKKSASSNTKIAVIFFVALAFIVGISFLVKLVAIIRASQFDSSKRFTLSVLNGKNVEVVSVNPSLSNVVVFKLSEKMTSLEAGRYLGIPIDGFIASNSLDLNQEISSLFMNAVIRFNSIKTNLTVIDLFKLTIMTKTIPENSINIVKVGEKDRLRSDNIVGNLVTDPFIEKDQQTIQIINGADVVGFGSRLARLINNIGGNVILVTTDDSLKNKSEIKYSGEKTYTAKRLQKILGYEVRKETGNVMSDITIIIGEDKINSAPF
jgi:hypothetical protein